MKLWWLWCRLGEEDRYHPWYAVEGLVSFTPSTVRCSSRKESEDHQVTTAETWERSSPIGSGKHIGMNHIFFPQNWKVTFNPYNKMYKSFKQMPYLKKILPYSVNLHHAKKTDKPRSYLISSIIRLLVIILKSNYCEMN